MSKYIGTPVVSLVTDTVDVTGDITTTDATPEVIIVNDTSEDTDGGREGKVTFKGQQTGGEETTLAQIQASHDGTSDDEKGDLIFKTNDGSDGASPTERVRIDSNGSILTATLGTDNVHLGEGAGASIVSGGKYNTLIGKDAGTALTTGDNNVAVGYGALSTEDANGRNTAIGLEALTNLNAGVDGENVAVGYRAGKAMTTGIMNTLIGTQAGDALTDADYNTVVGRNAMSNDTLGSRAVAIGYGALTNQNFTSATDNYNVGVGFNAGEQITSGTESTMIGGLAGDAITTGSHNTACGYQALSAATTTSHNTGIGRHAGLVATGSSNTFVGSGSGREITSGAKNTIIGGYGGNQDSLDLRTSSNNIVISDGDGNARLRCNQYGALSVRTDIDQGIYVFTGGTNNTNGKAMEFYDGDGHSCGVIRINQSANTVSYNTSSDHRLKENVTDLTGATTRLKQLQPKRFNFILDPNDTVHDGFMAHEVQTVVPEAISGTHNEVDDDGNPVYQGIDQSKLVPLLTAALQEAIAKIETLETKVAALEGE